MKVKILKGTALYDALDGLQERMKEARQPALALMQELGFTAMRHKELVLEGGVSSFIGDPPAQYLWRKAWWDAPNNEWMPRKRSKVNTELQKRIDALPVVKYDALNSLVGFDPFRHTGRLHTFHPSLIPYDGGYLMEFPENNSYKPHPDMIELTFSEFQALNKSTKTDTNEKSV